MVSLPDSDGVISSLTQSQSLNPPRSSWRAEADALRRNHMGGIAAMCLDALAPLGLVASQLLYAAGPFIGAQAIRLGRLLESEEALSDLSRYLTMEEDDRSLDTRVAID